MRIDGKSVENYSSGKVRVWLDGNEMDTGVLEEADDENGYVIYFITDKDGDFILNPRDDTIRTCRLEGDVRIALDGAELSKEAQQELKRLFTRDLT